MKNGLYRPMKKSEIIKELEYIKSIADAKTAEELKKFETWFDEKDETYLSSYKVGIMSFQIKNLIEKMKNGVINFDKLKGTKK